ncbi:oxidoreductase family protein [Flavicella sediminum]|uniref:oxidoreductase family protein n=1 Tax=Flavicella sediminum TaxID=2585141 RepID=UPI0011232218|nr:oxidoreductase family protein [Flavicella sediminum]
MNSQFVATLLKVTGASNYFEIEMIQSLWSGYGKIIRVGLQDSVHKTVVLKHVRLPKTENHPRGWNTDISHQRKIKSYAVESNFYKDFASELDSAKIPNCLAVDFFEEEVLMVLEDLDAVGYPIRKQSVNWQEIQICLQWLANFHAAYLHTNPKDLWEIGSYWHLDTRPEELDVLSDIPLKEKASKVDALLNNANYKTLVHGDAKLANFCFSENGEKVAAVDFQYVGGGCGMKDLAYFVGSCLHEEDCEKLEEPILTYYFEQLKIAVDKSSRPSFSKSINFKELEKEWRKLYPVAWTDFHRFLKGWSPGHWKINSYSERVAKEVLVRLK